MDLAKNYYYILIFYIYLDGESALSYTFDNLYSINSIIIERTPPYTKELNGKIKYTRKEISIKSRYIIINTNLPYNLWLETIITAVYILNRTPLFRTSITPFEALYGIKLILSHIYIYSYQAYPIKYNILKL